MNKLKMSLALIILMFPLLLCANKQRLNLEHCAHKSPIEAFIPVEAFFSDSDKELTIEFAQDWNPVTIEIKSKEGYIVYRNLYMPYSNSTLSIPLRDITSGTYKLVISDATQSMAGIFIY